MTGSGLKKSAALLVNQEALAFVFFLFFLPSQFQKYSGKMFHKLQAQCMNVEEITT
jgi:hypothetical protein